MNQSLEVNKCCDNYILDTIIRIDRLQKEAIINTDSNCVSCNESLIDFTNNTIPISFIMRCGGYLTANIGISTDTTVYFRIEAIRCNKYVTLRLLEVTEDSTLVATNRTLTLDADCICAIQCNPAIFVTPCNMV